MTYRERREAKAARLRGWADGREAKAAGDLGRAQDLADSIPLGQPILVGHHSEGRARRDRDRIHNGMRRGIENARKAEEMRARADNIERAAAHAIYSDDDDAVEKLRAKIAKLEAQRDRIKRYNASCRVAGKADPSATHGDLEILDERQKAEYVSIIKHAPYQIRKYGQLPAYASTNLGGTINAAKKRLAALA
ncbi:MAG TPA: DUF3560 domain-containing protein [Thermoleophilia bacterium]|nr:DUF3560 domain-containing protein [Thermoleophilia bacterium]